MSASRKIKRKQEVKKRKEAKKNLSKLNQEISSAPKECTSCGRKFLGKEHLDTWQISVWDSGRILLSCDECQESSDT